MEQETRKRKKLKKQMRKYFRLYFLNLFSYLCLFFFVGVFGSLYFSMSSSHLFTIFRINCTQIVWRRDDIVNRENAHGKKKTRKNSK